MTRQDQRNQGQILRMRLGLSGDGGPEAVAGFQDFADEVVYGGIWARPGLGLPDRMICTLAALSPLQRLDALKRHIGPALDLGLDPRAIQEVLLQSGLYAGFVTTEASGAVANSVFRSRGIAPPELPVRTDSLDELDRLGRETMAALHGERGTAGYAAPDNPITGALYPAAIRYGYGELWSRPGLDRRQRMLVAIAAFTAMGLDSQLEKFSQSALNVGLSKTEIVEAVIQTGPFGGFPRALNGLVILTRSLAKG
jgi:4-carboxymuconolactone decarboxylase